MNDIKKLCDLRDIPISGFTSLSEDICPDYLERLGKAGIRMFYLVCDLPWLKQPGLDLNSLERRLGEIKKAVPQANVMLRVNLHPPMAWLKQHPDELVQLSNGETLTLEFISCYYREKNVPFYSLVSSVWRQDAGLELEKLINYVADMKHGESVLGYFMAAGTTGEWGYGIADGFNGQNTFDCSPAFKRHFKSWLKRKYKTVSALQAAWKSTDIDFDSVDIPSLEQRSGHYAYNRSYENFLSNDADIKAERCPYAIGGFIDPDSAMAGFDFMLAWQHGICESIEYFCRVVKDVSKGKMLTGAFHGTLYQAGVRKILLPSPYIDFLASPGNYWQRCAGEITDIQAPINSYQLHGKSFIMEDDTRTHLAAPDISRRFASFTLEDSLTKLKRDFGRNVCSGLHGWWFDMFIPPKLDEQAVGSGRSLVSGGKSWYDDPTILALFKQQQEIAQLALNSDCSSISSIAVIFDEDSCLLGSINCYEKLIYYWRGSELTRLGAPLDFYYQDDLNNSDMPDYKLYIFVNIFSLNYIERERITAKVKRNNSTVLWLYAAGVCNESTTKRFSAEHISDLTGINIKQNNQILNPVFSITDSDNPMVRDVSTQHESGYPGRSVLITGTGERTTKPFKNQQMPNFYPDSDDCCVLGRFKENGKPALVYKDFPEWRSIYCGTCLVGSELLRCIAKSAGCHIICESDDFIFMNKHFLMIHAASDGQKVLQLPIPYHVVELYSNCDYGTCTVLKLEMTYGETKMFHFYKSY